ncbi:MAG: MobA/MobL family protein, partial [Thermosphaera sp.]
EIIIDIGTQNNISRQMSQITREKLWNTIQEVETRKNSELAKEIMIALPKEITQEEQISLAREYAVWLSQEYKIACDLTIHDKKNNPHAHIMVSTRIVEMKDGKLLIKGKQRRLKDKAFVDSTREKWEILLNSRLTPDRQVSRHSNKTLNKPAPRPYLPRAEYERLKRGKPTASLLNYPPDYRLYDYITEPIAHYFKETLLELDTNTRQPRHSELEY